MSNWKWFIGVINLNPIGVYCCLQTKHLPYFNWRAVMNKITNYHGIFIVPQWLVYKNIGKTDPDFNFVLSPFPLSTVKALLATNLVRDQLWLRPPLWNPVWAVCDLNFVMKSLLSDRSRKRPRPLLGLPNWTFPLFLNSRKRPLRVLLI